MFTVEKKTALQPLAELTGKWVECSPKTVYGFSAVGYFFGRDIHKATGAPVGMIHSSWGGTPAQAWTSLSGLEKDQELHGYVETVKSRMANFEKNSAEYPPQLADYEVKFKQWNEEVGKAYNVTLNAWLAENEKNKAEGKPLSPQPKLSMPRPVEPVPPDGGHVNPATLYNGMIAPVIPYAIKGVIWYQGEGNSGKSLEYRTLFPRMMADWREKWGQGEFPFLFVQIAPFYRMAPEIREAQLLSWKKTPHTAMVVTTDVGNAINIHPTQKEPVGGRLALAARVLAYGEKMEYSGPVFDTLKIEQNRAVLSFQHIGSGLLAKDGNLKGFTIAGADQKFIEAKAEIKGDTVVVSSEQVPAPVAVRYGWANVPNVNLYNKEGLPASPFRTDTESVK
jgi:sialate O-acetylesterase